jgi:hypothetical protein
MGNLFLTWPLNAGVWEGALNTDWPGGWLFSRGIQDALEKRNIYYFVRESNHTILRFYILIFFSHSIHQTAITFSLGINQWHVFAIRIVQLLRVKLSKQRGCCRCKCKSCVIMTWSSRIRKTHFLSSSCNGNSVMIPSFDLDFSFSSVKMCC